MTSSSQSGEFRSSPTAPDSTAPYPNGAECHFVADVETNYVSFTITYDVEPTFDFVEVKSGDETTGRAISGEDTATILVPTTDGKAELVFTSDPQGRRGGFPARPTWGPTPGWAKTASAAATGRAKAGPASLSRLRLSLLHRAHCLRRGARAVDRQKFDGYGLAGGGRAIAGGELSGQFEAAAGETIRVVVETLDLEPYDGLKGDRVLILTAVETVLMYNPNRGDLRNIEFQRQPYPQNGQERRWRDVRRLLGDRILRRGVSQSQGGDCEDEGFTCEDGYCYDLSGGSKRASGCTCAGCDAGSYLDTRPAAARPARRNVPAPGQEHGRRELVHRVLGGHGRARAGLGAVLLGGLRSRRSEVREVRRGRRGLQAHRHEVRYAGDAHGGDARDREGLLPLQPRGDGRLPVPGEGRRLRGCGPLKLVDSEDEYYGDRFCRDNAEGPLCLHCKAGSFARRATIRVQKLRQSRTTRAPARRDRRPHRRVVRRAVRRQGPADANFHRDWFEAVAIQFVFFFVTMSRFVGIHQITLPDPLFKYMWALDFISLDLTSIQSVLRCGSKVTYFDFLLFWTAARAGAGRGCGGVRDPPGPRNGIRART